MSSYSKASSSLLNSFAASVSRGSSFNMARSIDGHGALRIRMREGAGLADSLVPVGSLARRARFGSHLVGSCCITVHDLSFLSWFQISVVLGSMVVNALCLFSLFSLFRLSISSNIDDKFGKLSMSMTILMLPRMLWSFV